MESLRQQLAETQGALHEKIIQVRQLRADQTASINAWTQEKQAFEARLQRFQDELRQLRHGNEAAVGTSARVSRTQEDGEKNGNSSLALILMDEGMAGTPMGDEETVAITRSRIRDVESKFKDITDELAEKAKLCEALQRQLEAQGSSVRIPDLPEATDELVVARWEKLRGQIRVLSLAIFNTTIQPNLVPERARREFEHLSTHWKSYLTGEKLTCYIFRALIWRYLHTCVFKKYWRVWGKEYGDTVAKLAGFLESKATGATEFQNWRIHTARLFHETCKPDSTLVGAVTNKIFEATSPFATSDEEELKKGLSDIVAAAIDLSGLFARSQYLTLMSDKPGSDLTRGFAYQEATMDVKGKLGVQPIVDLMVSPLLLKKETEYSVLVKAEVIC
ncbi:hypothetical protein F5Y06DRAFT_263661 [Hypoxylon sp. FL0890]|nr:hypothetical protein F5Y06DRAFT_263661 [Hypoxylon sp. FL0890]